MPILLWPAGLVRSTGHVQNWHGYVTVGMHLVAKSAAVVMHVYVAIQSVADSGRLDSGRLDSVRNTLGSRPPIFEEWAV